MTGPKLNDGVMLLDGQVSTRATARFVRGSATKVREVLDLIRGLDVARADEVLRFTKRGPALDVRKVLASAVANAVHNDSQDAEELFVLACYADEGPTLKRFRARARGRASRINKRTCHVTVIVARMSDERLELVQARQAASTTGGRPGTSAAARRERVARSRARAEALRTGEGAVEGGDATDAADDTSVSASSESDRAHADTEAGDLPAGAVAAPEDGSVPEDYAIKGNTSSMKFHVPGGRYYDVTAADLYFDSAESAEAAGYEAPAADADKVHGEDD